MSTAPRLADYLGTMQQAAREILDFTRGLSRPDLEDYRVRRVLTSALGDIGEAASRILERHPAFAQVHPEVPWHGMKGMRNALLHGYFQINLDRVWNSVEHDIPALLAQLPGLLVGLGVAGESGVP